MKKEDRTRQISIVLVSLIIFVLMNIVIVTGYKLLYGPNPVVNAALQTGFLFINYALVKYSIKKKGAKK